MLHRKNALFYRTLDGSGVGDLFMNPAARMAWNYQEEMVRLASSSLLRIPVPALFAARPNFWYAGTEFYHQFFFRIEGTKGRWPVSSQKSPEVSAKPHKKGFSRRGFIRGVGIGGGALGTGLLEQNVAAAPAAGSVSGPGGVPITLNLNGKPVNVTVEPRVTLSDALRQYLDVTGSKRVCDRGTCGACTVLMNGKTVYSCTVLAIDAQGKSIQTIEGLSTADKLHPISQAFWDNDAEQCGYCTPGFVMAAKGLLDEHPNPSEADLKNCLGGNLCRCGTYIGVRKAVLEAAKSVKGAKNG